MSGTKKIFISYRRMDADSVVDAHEMSPPDILYERLMSGYDVFLDRRRGLKLSRQWPDELRNGVHTSDAMLVVIGEHWLDEIVRRASTGEEDWVREEVRLALQEKKLIIPVRVGGASVPDWSRLPEDIRDIGLWQTAELNVRNPHPCIEAIMEGIGRPILLTTTIKETDFDDTPNPYSYLCLNLEYDNLGSDKHIKIHSYELLLSQKVLEEYQDVFEPKQLIRKVDEIIKDQERSHIEACLHRVSVPKDAMQANRLKAQQNILENHVAKVVYDIKQSLKSIKLDWKNEVILSLLIHEHAEYIPNDEDPEEEETPQLFDKAYYQGKFKKGMKQALRLNRDLALVVTVYMRDEGFAPSQAMRIENPRETCQSITCLSFNELCEDEDAYREAIFSALIDDDPSQSYVVKSIDPKGLICLIQKETRSIEKDQSQKETQSIQTGQSMMMRDLTEDLFGSRQSVGLTEMLDYLSEKRKHNKYHGQVILHNRELGSLQQLSSNSFMQLDRD